MRRVLRFRGNERDNGATDHYTSMTTILRNCSDVWDTELRRGCLLTVRDLRGNVGRAGGLSLRRRHGRRGLIEFRGGIKVLVKLETRLGAKQQFFGHFDLDLLQLPAFRGGVALGHKTLQLLLLLSLFDQLSPRIGDLGFQCDCTIDVRGARQQELGARPYDLQPIGGDVDFGGLTPLQVMLARGQLRFRESKLRLRFFNRECG